MSRGSGFEQMLTDRQDAKNSDSVERKCAHSRRLHAIRCVDELSSRREKAVAILVRNERIPIYVARSVTTSAKDQDDDAIESVRESIRVRRHAVAYMYFIIAVVVMNAFAIALGSVRAWHGHEIFDTCLVFVDVISTIVFFVDYVLLLYSSTASPDFAAVSSSSLSCRLRWMTSLSGLVNLAAWTPLIVHLVAYHRVQSNDVFRALWLFRLLKIERYQKSFSVFGTIIARSSDVLVVSGFAALVTWIFASTLMYFFERNNTNTDTSFYYQSVADAMWITLLNLTGESPLWDYTPPGKVITALVGIFATGWFGIPIGLLAGGFESWVDEELKEKKFYEELAIAISTIVDRKHVRLYFTRTFWETFSPEDQLRYIRYVHFQTSGGRNVFGPQRWQEDVRRLVVSRRYERGQRLSFDHNDFQSLNNAQRMRYVVSCVRRFLRLRGSKRRDGNDDLSELCRASVVNVSSWRSASSAESNRDSVHSLADVLCRRPVDNDVESKTTEGDVERGSCESATVRFESQVLTVKFPSRSVPAHRLNVSPRSVPKPQLSKSDVADPLLVDYNSPSVYDVKRWIEPNIGYPARALIVRSLDTDALCVDHDEAKDVDGVERRRRSVCVTNVLLDDEVLPFPDDGVEYALQVSLISTFRRRTQRFISGQTNVGTRFQLFIMLLIILTVVDSILSSVKSIDSTYGAHVAFDLILEPIAVSMFTIEYLIRLYAAPDDPNSRWLYKHTNESTYSIVSRLYFIFSFFAIIDILAIVPFWLSVLPLGSISNFADDYDEDLRLLRIVRLLKLDKFVPSLSLIDDVFRAKSEELRVTTYVAGVMWLTFSTLMFFAERDGKGGPTPDEEEDNANRYRNIPNAMSFTLIHLTGDYPIVNYDFWGKTVCFFMTLVAVGAVGVPSGVIASGFGEQLEESRRRRRRVNNEAASRIAKVIRGYICRRRYARLIKKVREKESASGSRVVMSYNRRVRVKYPERHEWSLLLNHPRTRGFVLCLIIANVVAVVCETVDSINQGSLAIFFTAFEVFTVVIFTAEYVVRLYTASLESKYLFSTYHYAVSFYGKYKYVVAGFVCHNMTRRIRRTRT